MGRMLAHAALVGVVLSTSLGCSFADDPEDLAWGNTGSATVRVWQSTFEFEITPTEAVRNDDLLQAQEFTGLDFEPDQLWLVHYTARAKPGWFDDDNPDFSDLEIQTGFDQNWSGDPGFEAGIRANGGDDVAEEECPELDLTEIAEDGEASGCVFLVSGDDEPLEQIRFADDTRRSDRELRWPVEAS